MQALGRASLLAVFLGGSLLLSQAQAAVSCHNINAKGVGQDHFDLTTSADIIGGGLLQGTTAGSLTPTGISGTVVSFVGTVVFTTNNGTLTVTITGSIDVATGEFSATGDVTGATGKLAGATGTLTFVGVENLTTGAFTEDISGEICVDLAP